jgi:hypothetical protein
MLKPKICKAKNQYRVSFECVDGDAGRNFFGWGLKILGIFVVMMALFW